MAITTSNLTMFPYGKGGRQIVMPVDGATHIYKGSMVAQLAATGMLVPGSTAGAGYCVGLAAHEQDNSAGADGALRCEILTDSIYMFDNGSGANAVSEATLLGSPVFMFDDHTVYDNSAGDTLKRAGFFMGMEPDGKVRVFVTPLDIAGVGGVDPGESEAASIHGVRGASTADIADLAVFTVAGVDGLTYVAGERILLKNQSTASQNGIYVVGTVSGGTAPLTRALDFDSTDEIVPGALVHVSAGTVGLDSWFFLSTNAPITVGTTSLTFVEVPSLADLASTAGAGTIGILDTAAIITATNVETALAELAAIVTPITRIQVVTGTFVSGLCTVTVGAGQAVTAATKGFPCMSAIITGSANVGGVAHIIASNVVGGSGVGQVFFRVLGSDGNTDVDAAGLFAAILIN